MVEIIHVLNETSPLRTLFYIMAFLSSLAIAFDGIKGMFQSFNK